MKNNRTAIPIIFEGASFIEIAIAVLDNAALILAECGTGFNENVLNRHFHWTMEMRTINLSRQKNISHIITPFRGHYTTGGGRERREAMIRNRELAERIKASPYTYAEVARKAGISRETMLRRLERGDWRSGEVAAISEALEMGTDETVRLFLPGVAAGLRAASA